MTTIYKILSRTEWLAAKARGRFEGSGIDKRDGYIHFSTAAEVQETAHKHFLGESDLVVLEVDGEALDLKWEPSRGGALFPHLYAALDAKHVRAVHDAPLGPDNVPVLAFLR